MEEETRLQIIILMKNSLREYSDTCRKILDMPGNFTHYKGRYNHVLMIQKEIEDAILQCKTEIDYLMQNK
jgi:hypothetical protein